MLADLEHAVKFAREAREALEAVRGLTDSIDRECWDTARSLEG